MQAANIVPNPGIMKFKKAAKAAQWMAIFGTEVTNFQKRKSASCQKKPITLEKANQKRLVIGGKRPAPVPPAGGSTRF